MRARSLRHCVQDGGYYCFSIHVHVNEDCRLTQRTLQKWYTLGMSEVERGSLIAGLADQFNFCGWKMLR